MKRFRVAVGCYPKLAVRLSGQELDRDKQKAKSKAKQTETKDRLIILMEPPVFWQVSFPPPRESPTKRMM